MIRLNSRGQTMVEAVGALWILFLMFVCIYYLFLMSLDKIRSLDTAYHLARARQVQKESAWPFITSQCFGGRGRMLSPRPLSNGPGPTIDEVVFQFLPHTFQTGVLPWKSVMRVVESKYVFLDKSWPKANADSPASTPDLDIEMIAVKGLLEHR